MRTKAISLALLTALLLVETAAAQAPQAPRAPGARSNAAAPAAQDKALVAFAKEIEKGLAAGRGKAFDSRVDLGALVDKATARVQAPPQMAAGFGKGLTDNFTFGDQIVKELQADGASYKFLRLKRVDGETRALFRLVGPNGINYHELTLDTTGPRPRVTDVYIYITGESLSQTFRRAFLQMAMSEARGKAAAEEFMAEFEKVRQMAALTREGNGAEAMAVYNTMSPKTQAQKIVQVSRVMAAANLDEKLYAEVMEDYRNRFKDDPTVDLVSIDAHFLRGDFEQATAAVDRVDKAVGGDPYLEVMRGSFSLAQGKTDEAKARAQKALKAEPGLYQAYDLLLSVSLAQKDHAETARLLGVFEDKFGMEFGDLSNVEDFKPFRQSDAYRKWRQRQ